MPCTSCSKRLERLLRFLGFEPRIEGGWERTAQTGYVLLDLKPSKHTRFALIALFVAAIQGRAAKRRGVRSVS